MRISLHTIECHEECFLYRLWGESVKFSFKARIGAKPPLLHLFMGGFCLGMILMNFFKQPLLVDTGLLDEYTLYHLKYITIDSNVFFVYVLRERLGMVLVLSVLSTTYLGLAAVWIYTVWMGAAAGMLLSACVIRYGMKGLFLAVTGIFPQQLLLVPACIFLLYWCYDLCANIYFPGLVLENYNIRSKQKIAKKILQLCMLIGVVIMGCVLESYVNPQLLIKFLKIF